MLHIWYQIECKRIRLGHVACGGRDLVVRVHCLCLIMHRAVHNDKLVTIPRAVTLNQIIKARWLVPFQIGSDTLAHVSAIIILHTISGMENVPRSGSIWSGRCWLPMRCWGHILGPIRADILSNCILVTQNRASIWRRWRKKISTSTPDGCHGMNLSMSIEHVAIAWVIPVQLLGRTRCVFHVPGVRKASGIIPGIYLLVGQAKCITVGWSLWPARGRWNIGAERRVLIKFCKFRMHRVCQFDLWRSSRPIGTAHIRMRYENGSFTSQNAKIHFDLHRKCIPFHQYHTPNRQIHMFFFFCYSTHRSEHHLPWWTALEPVLNKHIRNEWCIFKSRKKVSTSIHGHSWRLWALSHGYMDNVTNMDYWINKCIKTAEKRCDGPGVSTLPFDHFGIALIGHRPSFLSRLGPGSVWLGLSYWILPCAWTRHRNRYCHCHVHVQFTLSLHFGDLILYYSIGYSTSANIAPWFSPWTHRYCFSFKVLF